MTEEVVIGVAIIQTILSAMIAVFSFYRFRRRDRLMLLVGLLFLFSVAFNVLQFSAFFWGKNVLMNRIGSIYEIVFFVVAGLIYDAATRGKLRKPIIVLTIVFVCGSIINILFSPMGLPSIIKFASNIFVIVYCVVYFFQLMRELPTIHVHRLPMFWINSSFLLYSAGTVFIFGFIEYMIKQHADKVAAAWVANLILFIVHQLIIMVAVVYDLKQIDSGNIKFKGQF